MSPLSCVEAPSGVPADPAPAPDPDRYARFLGALSRLRQEAENAGYAPCAGLLLDQALLLFTRDHQSR